MKTRNVILLSALVLAGSAAILLATANRKPDPRRQYEKFLVSQHKGLGPIGKNENKTAGREETDHPEMAAFDEYIKTLDPVTRRVPRERIVAANEKTDALASLKSTHGQLTWNAHPTNMGGRTRTLMFDPNDPQHAKLWAGSVTGGLWYNPDPAGGGEWTPVNDFWSDLSISCMTYDPNNPQTFYVGTGESQTALIMYRESSGLGTGIMRSTNGGTTWQQMPSTRNWPYVTDILVRNENGLSIIYAGVASGIYKGEVHRAVPTDGLYRSADNGETWTQVLPNIPGKDYAYAPSDIETSADDATIYVGTTYGVNADGTDNDRSGAACLLTSTDGINWNVNNTWQQKILTAATNKYPGRVMLCQAPSNADIAYAIVAAGYVRSDDFIGYGVGYLLKTTDKGATWSEVNVPDFASLAWHAFVINVSPLNPNLIWVGGLDTWRTVNGGTSWTKQSDWAKMYSSGDDYVHADIHAIVFRPGSDTEMYIGTDGGVFGTRTASAPDSGMKFFEVANQYSTLQYYSCALHPDAGAVHYIGGLQDNGTMFYRANHTPTYRDMLSGGDGALCFIDQNEPTIQITTVYYNAIYVYTGDKESAPQLTGYKNLNTGTFVNAMDYDWKNNFLFANGGTPDLKYLNTLATLTISANSVTGSSTGRTLSTHSQVPYSNIKWSEWSPVNTSNIFIGTEAGQLFKLTDASHTGTLTELTSDDFPTGNISCIDIGASEDTLLVTFSNYGVPSVWLSVNGGSSWKNVEGNLPDMPVRWGIFHPQNSQQVMLATETGIWTTGNIRADQVVWTPDNAGMANVRVDMVKYRPSDHTVLAATHGRGMFTTTWTADFLSGRSDIALDNARLRVFPNPSDGRFTLESSLTGKTTVVIMDLSGRQVMTREISGRSGTWQESFDLSAEPKGTYLVGIRSGNQTETRRLLLTR